MAQPNLHVVSHASDADAEYVKRKLTEAAQHDAEAKSSQERASECKRLSGQARIEAGLRLIEVRGRLSTRTQPRPSEKSMGRPRDPFQTWLRENGIAQQTAHTVMRDAGYTEEEREEGRNKEAQRKRSERAKKAAETVLWAQALGDHLGGAATLTIQNGYKKAVAMIGREFPQHFVIGSDELKQFLADMGAAITARQSSSTTKIVDDARSTLSDSAKERFDKALAKAQAAYEGAFQKRRAELQASYEDEVRKAVKARIAPEIEAHKKHADEQFAHWKRQAEIFNARAGGIKQAMTKADWQFLIGMLHPDRAPDGWHEKFHRAFQIIHALKPYIEAFD